MCPRVAATKANRQAPTKTKTAKDTLEQPGQDQDCKKGVKKDGKGADARGEVADLQEPLEPKWLCQQSTDATTNCTGNWRNGCKPWPLVNKQIHVFPAVLKHFCHTLYLTTTENHL